MQVEVLNIKGQATGRSVELPDEIFGIEPNDHLIYLSVKQYLAAQRQGNSKVKTRAEVQGASRKLHKQKGTGGARAGSIKSPLMRGGARVFGPHPRDYSFKLNRKLKELARVSALSYKAKSNSIIVLEDFTYETPKTKNFAELLQNLKLDGRRTLMVLADVNKAVYLSSRNLQRAKVIRACDLNTYEIVKAHNLVILESTIAEIEKTFQN